MVDLTERAVVCEWLAMLAVRCVPKRDEDIELLVRTYAPGLAKDIPRRAFCDDSLESLARQFEYFPAYATLRKAIDTWIDRNPVVLRAIPAPAIPDMPAADRAMVGIWTEYHSGVTVLPKGVTLESWLSLCRATCPTAFRHIINTNNTAGEIAVRRRWDQVRRQGDPDAEEVDYVHKRVQDCLYAGSRTFDPSNPKSTVTPDAMDQHVPPQPLPASVVDAFEEKHGRKPGQLSPEQLEAVRQRANGPRAPANDPKPPKSNMEPTNFFEL